MREWRKNACRIRVREGSRDDREREEGGGSKEEDCV